MGTAVQLDRADILQSWMLQVAIIVAFALSTFGVTYVLRRSAMRALSTLWGLYVCAGLTGLAASYLSSNDGPRWLVLTLFTLSPGFVLASLPANVRLVDATGERTSRWPLSAPIVVTVGVGACAIVGLGTVGAALLLPGTVFATAFWPRSWNALMYAGSAAYALRAARNDAGHRGALRLLAVGFALMAVRVAINALVGVNLFGSASTVVTASVVGSLQVFSIVTFGVLSLLAALYQERTAILNQAERLREAESRMAASQRLESLGRLSAGVAHDFNNILHAISAGADLARGEMDDRPALEAELAGIEAAAARAADLTRQLQLFARAQPQKPVRFEVGSRLEGVIAMLKRLLGHGVALSVSEAPEPLTVEMDPSRLDQVILNLVVNARDAMPSGGTIRIETSLETLGVTRTMGHVELPPGRYARLSVTDSGAGIAPDVLPRIFEPFYTTKKGGRGSGIGLATCQSIALEARGAIAVESSDAGTRFDVLLPLAS
jgi:signal transduction histidine kinase